MNPWHEYPIKTLLYISFEDDVSTGSLPANHPHNQNSSAGEAQAFPS